MPFPWQPAGAGPAAWLHLPCFLQDPSILGSKTERLRHTTGQQKSGFTPDSNVSSQASCISPSEQTVHSLNTSCLLSQLWKEVVGRRNRQHTTSQHQGILPVGSSTKGPEVTAHFALVCFTTAICNKSGKNLPDPTRSPPRSPNKAVINVLAV